MKSPRSFLALAATAGLIVASIAVGYRLASFQNHVPAAPATAGKSPRGGAAVTQAIDPAWTLQARPTALTSLLLLDLSKVPSEKELRMAGQLGEELIPTRPANPADMTDAAKRRLQEQENSDFGHAIQKWNLHEYDPAYSMFLDHLTRFPESAWAAEAELHLGCFCQYKGRFEEAQKFFEASQSRSPTGHPMNAKSTLRLGALSMEQGRFKSATQHFASLRAASDTPSHASYASYWITRLSLMKQKQTAMRDCAQKSLAEVCAVLGKPEAAKALRVLENQEPDGLSLLEIEKLAEVHGLTAHTVVTTAEHLAALPTPFIAHLDREEHFITVLSPPRGQALRVFDSRVGHAHEADLAAFLRQWSGHAVLFAAPPVHPAISLASLQARQALVGGCCGEPKEPDDLACGKKKSGGCTSCGMPEWAVNPVNMNLQVTDTPMWWDAPYGPDIHLTLTYNSLDSLGSIRPFGDKWSFAYAAYAMEDPSGAVIIMYGNGYTERYTPKAGGGYKSQARHAETTLTKTGTYSYEVEDGDGEKWTFSVPISIQGASAASLLTRLADKYGTTVSIEHNSQGAVTSLSHSALPEGQNTWTLAYGANGKVATITDPWARDCTFSYDNVGRLTGQTDMGDVAYGYAYTSATRVRERDPLFLEFGHNQEFVERSNELFISSLQLPTGTWQFLTEPADGIAIPPDTYPMPGSHTWETYRITITDPLGLQEEYFYAALNRGWHRDKKHYRPGVPAYGSNSWALTDPATRYLYSAVAGRGEISRTEHQGGGSTETPSNMFTDAGQPLQTIAPDGRNTYFTYNDKGNVLTRQEGETEDPDCIVHTTTYADNGIDVTGQSRTVGGGQAIPESSTIYEPLTRNVLSQTQHVWNQGSWLDQKTSYTYNAQGQVLTLTSPRGAVTRNTYFTTGLQKGRLEKVEYKAPNQAAFKVQALYSYDDIGRVLAEQDAEGYVLIHDYDALNRRLKTTYPDQTYTQSVYSCCTLSSSRARDGSLTQYSYDALKRVTQVVSPGGQAVAYEYDASDNVTRLRFGRGEWVAWEYDEGNRVTAKIYPDDSRLTYGYDRNNGGRLAWTKDASNRQTTYSYNADSRIETVSHPSLPAQGYTYDAEGRTKTWTEGTGGGARVTNYDYDLNGRLKSVDGPLADDTIIYNYDQWGRLASWEYGGGSESYTFDDLDRVTQVTNPLGIFIQGYEGDTGILNEVQYPLPGMKTTYQRQPALQDRLLTAIIHTAPVSQGGGELARYDYTYNAQRQIATWRQQQPGMSPKEWGIAYDPRQQVTAVVETPVGAPVPTPQQVWRYQYDASGNRTAAQEGSRTRTATYNNLNQLVSQTAGGTTWFRGKVNEPANVTIAGQNARVYADGTFESLTPVGAGVQDVEMKATDKSGNTTTQTWRVDNGAAGTQATQHDGEGNLLTDGRYTYTWDARNRMTSVTLGADTWSFQYDGQNRRIAESKNGQAIRTWVWHGTSILEERTVNGGVKQRYWTGGLELLTTTNQQTGKRLLITDHLGSTRAAVDGISGAVTASYSFTPWGKRSRTAGSEDLSNGYTGHLWHESGLSLAVYRPYDPETGRWPCRDPIWESGGRNLFQASANNPIGYNDYLGLKCKVTIRIHHSSLGGYKDPGSIPHCEKHHSIACYTRTDEVNDMYIAQGDGVPHAPRVGDDSRASELGFVGPNTSNMASIYPERDGNNGAYAGGKSGFVSFLENTIWAAKSAALDLYNCPCECDAVSIYIECVGVQEDMAAKGLSSYCGMTIHVPRGKP